MTSAKGPLAGIKILEFAGIGPAPFAVMLLADLGASVIRIDRTGATWPQVPIVSRGRSCVVLDLRSEDGLADARALLDSADVLVEGFRPGVMERLGLGPEDTFKRNPGLVYGRMTGWGQSGPRAKTAGHDVNYIALTGMLDALGSGDGMPRAPLNLLGDYGAGGLYLALGIVSALFERRKSGLGQVVDAAIVDGAASMLAPIMGMSAAGLLGPHPSRSMLAGDAAYYRTYRCADGKCVAVGPLEEPFREQLTRRLDLPQGALDGPDGADVLSSRLSKRTRDEWNDLFADTDACVTPVLRFEEAVHDPHLSARGTYQHGPSGVEPAPAPRLSRTPGQIGETLPFEQRLREWKIPSLACQNSGPR